MARPGNLSPLALPAMTSSRLAGVSVGFTVVGMLFGTTLVLSSTYQSVGWMVFVLSCGNWFGAALLALREGWNRGWFDR